MRNIIKEPYRLVHSVLALASVLIVGIATGCSATYVHRVDMSPKLVNTDKKKVSETLDLSKLRLIVVGKPTAENPMLSVRAEAPVIEHCKITETYRKRYEETTVTAKWYLTFVGYVLNCTLGLPFFSWIWHPIELSSYARQAAKKHAIAGISKHDGPYLSPCKVCGVQDSGLNWIRITAFNRRDRLGESFTKTRETEEKTAWYKPVDNLVLQCFLEDTIISTRGITDNRGACSFDMVSLLTRMKRPWTGRVVIEATEYPSARVTLSLTEKQVIKIMTSKKQ